MPRYYSQKGKVKAAPSRQLDNQPVCVTICNVTFGHGIDVRSVAVAFLTASLLRPLLVAAAGWSILYILRIRHPASIHAVWTAVLAGMLLTPAASVIAPHWRLPVLPAQRIVGTLPAPEISFSAPAQIPMDSSPPQPANSIPGKRFRGPGFDDLVLWIYGAGFCAMALYRLIGWLLLRRVIARSVAVRGRVRESVDVRTPVAVGAFHPRVLLPEGWREWNPGARRAVLANEFAHLRRGDVAISALARFVRCVFWFHPLAWWLARALADCAELACDAAALEKLHDPSAYSRVLLEFAAAVHRAGYRAALPGLAMAARANLGHRIERIFQFSERTPRKLSHPGAWLAVCGLPLLLLAATGALREANAVSPEQSPPRAAFEVASIKPAQRAQPGEGPFFCVVPCDGATSRLSGSRVDIRYMTISQLIVTAYRIKSYQLSGPDWMQSQRFDIAARMPSAAPSRFPEMLQTLLAERFHLTIHRESRELPVYALKIAPGGPHLQPAEDEEAAKMAPGGAILHTPNGEGVTKGGAFVVSDQVYGPIRGGLGASGAFQLEFLKLTMPRLADLLAPHLDRPVIDQTNWQGAFFLRSENRSLSDGGTRKGGSAEGEFPGGAHPDPYGEGLFQAVRKAGLKLEKTKAPIEVVVVDRLDKTPAAN